MWSLFVRVSYTAHSSELCVMGANLPTNACWCLVYLIWPIKIDGLGSSAEATTPGHLRMQLHTPSPLFGVDQPLMRRLPQPHQALQATRQTF